VRWWLGAMSGSCSWAWTSWTMIRPIWSRRTRCRSRRRTSLFISTLERVRRKRLGIERAIWSCSKYGMLFLLVPCLFFGSKFFFGSNISFSVLIFFLAQIYFNWLSLFFSGILFNLATKGFLKHVKFIVIVIFVVLL